MTVDVSPYTAAVAAAARNGRWCVSRKQALLRLIELGWLIEGEACERYGFSAEELATWRHRAEVHGRAGLAATKSRCSAMAETWTLDDGSEVRSYRPSNGTEGEAFMSDFCARCACEPADHDAHDGCHIIAYTMALNIGDPEYPREWVERVSDGQRTCTAFRARPLGWDGVPDDPREVEKQRQRYDALPRDPATGRPVL